MNEDDLKDLLETKGIVFEDDTVYENMLLTIKAEIVKSIGIPLDPIEKIQLVRNFEGSTLVVDYYPIEKINSLTINGKELTENEDYTVDATDGIIYLENPHKGFLKLEHTYCLTQTQYELFILPLIMDMFEYHMDTGWDKNASSISEGDITVSFDTSIGKGALIQKQLENLKEEFSTFGRMI